MFDTGFGLGFSWVSWPSLGAWFCLIRQATRHPIFACALELCGGVSVTCFLKVLGTTQKAGLGVFWRDIGGHHSISPVGFCSLRFSTSQVTVGNFFPENHPSYHVLNIMDIKLKIIIFTLYV